ncbi:hypothetical protein DFH28DRAFT_898694 [Melampsora americana]|nr:hypothetical protein DFH28DRAFT_898694 [Melampsora americana]
MKKADQISEKTVKREPRRLPKVPIPSMFTRAPKELPIDFYDPQWFAQLNPGQKRLIPDAGRVAFLPDANQSLLPTQHPDERLSDQAFNVKYLESLSEPYRDALDEIDDADYENEDEDGDSTGSVNGANPTVSNMDADEDESDFYSEGDFGDLYDDSDSSNETDDNAIVEDD